jgi:hypothetical protein
LAITISGAAEIRSSLPNSDDMVESTDVSNCDDELAIVSVSDGDDDLEPMLRALLSILFSPE